METRAGGVKGAGGIGAVATFGAGKLLAPGCDLRPSASGLLPVCACACVRVRVCVCVGASGSSRKLTRVDCIFFLIRMMAGSCCWLLFIYLCSP